MPRKEKQTEGTATKAVPARLTKADVMERWGNLDEDQPPTMTPIPAGHKGSTYAQDGIRVTGSQAWIDWILSRIKPVIEMNGNGSRLDVIYTQTVDRETGQLTGSWALYLKASESSGKRGRKPKSEPKTREPKPKAKEPETKPVELSPPPPAKDRRKGSKNDPLYAIGKEDEEEGYIWAEPTNDGSGWPMETYEDLHSLDQAMRSLEKVPEFKKSGYSAIQVALTKPGRVKIIE